MLSRAFLFLVCLCVLPAYAQDKTNAKGSNVLTPIQDAPGLPRVLLIGDSISMGYTLPVRQLLEGKANVHRIPQNGGPTKNGLAKIDSWLGTSKWDVIHFNHGIHDVKIMPDGKRQVEPAEYEANLRAIVTKLKATGAKLIFATSTPIPPSPLVGNRNFGSEKEYNAIATRVMNENGVIINDLHSYMLPRFDELHNPNDLHYKPEGYDFLAKRVAEVIAAALPKTSASSR
jgi:lysophospholipase L1-like esterase